jgi:hypothetical protein
MKRSIQLAIPVSPNTLRNYDSGASVTDIFGRSIVHASKLVAGYQLLGQKVEREILSPMNMAVQEAKQDHKKVIDNYNKAKQQRALKEAAAETAAA